MFAIGIAVTVFRLPTDDRGTLWAEDGAVFLTDAFRNSFLNNLTTPYAGYLHVFPRIAAEITSVLPIPADLLGLVMNLWGAAAWSLVAVAAFVFLEGRVRKSFRLLLWLLTLLIPIGSFEVATNVANSHWFLLFGMFLALSCQTAGRSRTIFSVTLVVLAVLSDPLSLAFSPLVALRLLLLRGWNNLLVTTAYLAAALIQVLAVLNTTRDRGEPVLRFEEIGRNYLVRVVWQTLTGPHDGSILLETLGSRAVLLISMGVLAAMFVLVVTRRKHTALAVAAVLFSGAFFAAVQVLTLSALGLAPPGSELIWGGRYLVTPGLMLLTAIIVIADAWLPLGGKGIRSTASVASAILLAAVLLLPGVRNYQSPQYRPDPLGMTDSLDRADAMCESGESSEVAVEIAPEGFFVALPCTRVLDR